MTFLKHRKSKTGCGIFVSLLTMSAFIYVWPYCADVWWRDMSALIQEHDMTTNEFYFLWSILQACIMSLIVHSFYGICYYGEFTFIEKYKVADEPWPWKTKDGAECKEWTRKLYDTLKVYMLNVFVISHSLVGLLVIFDLPHPIGTSPIIPTRLIMMLQFLFCALV